MIADYQSINQPVVQALIQAKMWHHQLNCFTSDSSDCHYINTQTTAIIQR